MRVIGFQSAKKLNFWQKIARFFFFKPKTTYYTATLNTRWPLSVNTLILLNNGVKMLVIESDEKTAKLITIKRISNLSQPSQYFIVSNNWLKT